MRTARSLTVSPSMLCFGGGGVPGPGGACSVGGGVPGPGGVGCGIPACTEADPPREQNDRQV